LIFGPKGRCAIARTGVNESKAANQAFSTEGQQAYTGAQNDVNQYNKNVATLTSGKNVAANPYLNPQYLSAVNRLQSGALNQATNAGAEDIRQLNRRTGGMNSTAALGEIGKLALQKGQLGSDLSAGRTAQDWQKNIGYQLQMAQAPLASAGTESNLYGTATGGQSAALKNLTDLGMAAYGPWMAAIQAAGGASKAKGGGGGGGGA